MITKAIKNFHKQFEYEPEIKNKEALKKSFSKFIIAGMGGSNLVPDLLRIRDPYIDIIIHKNYGLPKMSKQELEERLLIASSYSGNTEETIDFLKQAISQKLSAAVVATGGQLIDLAKEYRLPHIQMPATGIQPRSAIGFNIKAIAKFIGRDDLLEELTELTKLLKPEEFEKAGEELAKKLKGCAPIIYSSTENIGLSYIWKITFNETGKIPAFYNVLPELNHNEMAGFNVKKSNQKLSERFYFIILKDVNDHPRVQKRMELTEKLYRERDLPVEVLTLRGSSIFHKIFNSLILADWTCYYTALQYNLEPEQEPMIEEFKRLIQ